MFCHSLKTSKVNNFIHRPLGPLPPPAALFSSLAASGDSFLYCDQHGVVRWMHISSSISHSISPQSMVGGAFSQAWRLIFDIDGESLSQIMGSCEYVLQSDGLSEEMLCEGSATDGSRRAYLVRIEPVFGRYLGIPSGVVIRVRESILSGEGDWALKQLEKRCDLLLRGSDAGIWEYVPPSGRVLLSPRFRVMLGLTADNATEDIDSFRSRIHPEDENRFNDELEALLRGEISEFSCETRLRIKNGLFRWFKTRAVAECCSIGPAARISGSITDLSKVKVHQEMLVAANYRLEKLVEDLPMGVLVEDSRHQIVLANSMFCRLMKINVSQSTLIGANSLAVFASLQELFVDSDQFVDRVTEILKQRTPVSSEVLQLVDGRTFERDFLPEYLSEDYGANYWIYRDISQRRQYEERIERYNSALEEKRKQLEEMNAKLSEMASTDELTNVPNRRAFEERLRLEIERSSRMGSPLAVIMADVDRFKLYNDEFGHVEGDTVLRIVAKVLKDNKREYDLVARYGGEEFVVIMPGAEAEDGIKIAERFRFEIENWPWTRKKVTASFGVAVFDLESDNTETLISQADAALYQSKESGRNQVTLASREF
jgi:diguanylate cyclase (GGDEF)-like protein